jgi:hypothetical protein
VRKVLTHTYPVPLKKGFDYLDDFKMWPDWYVGMASIVKPEEGAWIDPGDEVRFIYKLLGRRLEGLAILEERKEGELVKFRTEVPGLPTVHFEYHYAEAGTENFVVRVAMETEEPTSFFGKAIDRALLPTVLARDLQRSLENLEDLFAAGLLE